MKDLVIVFLGGILSLIGFATAVFAIVTALCGVILTVCGTVSFWSWLLGGKGFVALCLS